MTEERTSKWTPETAFLVLEEKGARLMKSEKTGTWIIRVPASPRLSLRSCGAFDYLVHHYGLEYSQQLWEDRDGKTFKGVLSHSAKISSLVNARRITKEKSYGS